MAQQNKTEFIFLNHAFSKQPNPISGNENKIQSAVKNRTKLFFKQVSVVRELNSALLMQVVTGVDVTYWPGVMQRAATFEYLGKKNVKTITKLCKIHDVNFKIMTPPFTINVEFLNLKFFHVAILS